MSVEIAVRARLAATVAVTALVSTRIYQLKLPEKPTLPAIRVQLIDEPKAYQLRGEDGATRSRVQIDVYGSEAVKPDPYTAVVAVADAVNDALSGHVFEAAGIRVTGAMRASRRVGYEAEELRLVRCSQDFTVWWKEL